LAVRFVCSIVHSMTGRPIKYDKQGRRLPSEAHDIMKTPVADPNAVRIVVRPPRGAAVPAPALAAQRLSDAEAAQIVDAIRQPFADYVARYDTSKYPQDVYRQALREFRKPKRVSAGTLRHALLWKYGHLGKPAIPQAHEALISQLQRGWRAAADSLPGEPENLFEAIDRDFGGRTRFITVAFLLHLLHPRKVPIVDQHNFRAVNALFAGVRPGWRSKRRPSTYADIALIGAFMDGISRAWRRRAPASVPSRRKLDLFLMMYGKSIKVRGHRRQ